MSRPLLGEEYVIYVFSRRRRRCRHDLLLVPSLLLHIAACLFFVKNRILAAIGVGFMLTVVGFKIVVPDDPYAMLDDTYLSTLKGDDDMANEAAKKVRKKYLFRVLKLGGWPVRAQPPSRLRRNLWRQVRRYSCARQAQASARVAKAIIFGDERTMLPPFYLRYIMAQPTTIR